MIVSEMFNKNNKNVCIKCSNKSEKLWIKGKNETEIGWMMDDFSLSKLIKYQASTLLHV